MKGLLEQPAEVLYRVVHYLSPWDIEAFTSTHSRLRCVGSQALAAHCQKKQRFSHLELGCNETIHPLDLISDLLDHEENVEYVQSLSVGYDDAINSKDSKTSPDKIAHLLSKYPNLKAKAEQVMKASNWVEEEVTFPSDEDWTEFPHLFPAGDSGYTEDIMYFLMSLSPNLKLLRLIAIYEETNFEPLRYLINALTSGGSHDAVPSCHLREVRLDNPQMAQWCELLRHNVSLEVFKAQDVIDTTSNELYNSISSRQHPSLHTIVFQTSAVSATTFHRLLHQAKFLCSFTYCYKHWGEGPQWEPHQTLTILRDTASDRLVYLDMTHPGKELSPHYTFAGLQSNMRLLRGFKVLRTLRLESILLFHAKIKDGSPLAKSSFSTKRDPPKVSLEMEPLKMQQLWCILPDSAAKVSLVGNLYKADAVVTTRRLVVVKARAPAFSELVFEGIHSRRTEELRRAIQAECNSANVALRIFPTRLDAPPEVWWKAQS